jgi:hypothetical protein
MSRNSSVGISTGYFLEELGLDSQQRKEIFLFFRASKPILGTTQWLLGALSPDVKRQGFEANYSPPSIAEVKNGEVIILPDKSSWRKR